MKFLKILLLTGLLIPFELFAIERYPEWFLFPAKYPQVITGYSYGGNSAVYDAENMYCALKSCVVYGTLEIFDASDQSQWLKNSNYYYYFSPDSVEKIHGRLVSIDSFQTNILTGDYISAFMLDSAASVNSGWVNVDELTPPSWIDKIFWQDQQYSYGVGMYTSIGNENDAWKTAEEQAIFAILNNLAVGYYKLQFSMNETTYHPSMIEEISFIRLKYLLKNIQILERYPDVKNKLYYVLVRIPNRDIISPMLNRKPGGG
ncbi:MAG: hypothetical protein GXO77_08005 [Calditrichaeota bacterium]|nr:hypothetical protein [Calditrichota bacterium]